MTERTQRQQVRDRAFADLAQFQHRVDGNLAQEVAGAQACCGERIEARAEFVYPRSLQCHAGRVLVAAESNEKIGHGFQSFQQVERRDAAAGALSQAIIRVAAQHKHGTLEPFYQAYHEHYRQPCGTGTIYETAAQVFVHYTAAMLHGIYLPACCEGAQTWG